MKIFCISTFLNGLRVELRIIVTMFKPNTLSAAFKLARLQVEELGWRHTPTRTTNNHYSPNPNYPKQTTLRLPSPNPLPKFPTPLTLPQPNLNPQRKYPLPIKILSVSQM